MHDKEGWLTRVARRFVEAMGSERAAAIEQDFAEEDAPVISAADKQSFWQNVPPGVRVDENGRYVAGGYSFSTIEQASSYAARLERPVAPVPVQLPPTRKALSSTQRGNDREAPRWIREPSQLAVAGRVITTDLVYFGTPLRYEPRHDQSRIDPTLPLDSQGDLSGTTLNYWPSYAGMHPRARWTYLDWLSRGRTGSTTPIGYVFVFFYGLEQRLLVDDAKEEAAAIFAEVRRLLDVYGEDYSFRSYASRLLALSCLYEDEPDRPPTLECARNYDLELPLDLRVRLGQRLRHGQPLTADDALRWVLALPDVYLRTPAQRCFDELRELWTHRFASRHPDGLLVRRPRALIKHEYRAASGTFTCSVSVGDLPDISGVSAPLASLRALLDACSDDISAFSRLLGRDPEARGRIRGDLLLPAELKSGRKSLDDCRTALLQLAARDRVTGIPALEVARILDVATEAGIEKLPSAMVRQVGVALDALDIGFEPDRRYGPAGGLRADTRLCLFEFPGGAPVDPERPAYVAGRAAVEVAILAAASDGEVVAAELNAIDDRLRRNAELSAVEVTRLKIYGRALAADPPKVRAALKKLSEVASSARSSIAASAVEAVLADGRVHPDEVRFLEALHSALNIPHSALYSAIHRSGEDLGPVTIVEQQRDHEIPLPAEALPADAVSIDGARLERIRNETRRVSALLTSIFVEEEAEQPATPKAPPISSTSAFSGLDAAHSKLLQRLIDGPLSRAEFEKLASELRLMPDGAIEALNEWGFDQVGDAIVEDGEEVCIAPDLAQQIAPMGVAV